MYLYSVSDLRWLQSFLMVINGVVNTIPLLTFILNFCSVKSATENEIDAELLSPDVDVMVLGFGSRIS